MAEKRKTITKKLRFEVFKRDSFTCQYCGRMAPDVVLEVDHINPVANNGKNDIMNLVTSCFDCNRGKGKTRLTDKDEIKKQQEQLKELNQRREQLKMMLDWRKELEKFEDEQFNEFLQIYEGKTSFTLTDTGIVKTKKWIKEFGLLEVIEVLDISIAQYFDASNPKNTIEKVFNYIPRICYVRAKQQKDPMIGKRNYIKAVIKNRFKYIDFEELTIVLNNVVNDCSFEDIKNIAIKSESWDDFLGNYYNWELDTTWNNGSKED